MIENVCIIYLFLFLIAQQQKEKIISELKIMKASAQKDSSVQWFKDTPMVKEL